MPTVLDRALHSKNAVLAFGAAVGAAAVFSIWGGDMFPAQKDPEGDPDNWEVSELRQWLAKRNLHPAASATRQELVERVKANMKI